MENNHASLKTLKSVIPEACFQPSVPTSVGYLLRDLTYASLLVYCASFIHLIPFPWLRTAAWTLYGFFQGCVGVGFWVLAHECGHGAFSLYPWLNDTVGWVLHSVLLTPYFSWKITHARHHRFTSHMTKDAAFVPYNEAEYRGRFSRFRIVYAVTELLEDTPVMSFLIIASQQLLGWPLYILFSVSAGNDSRPRESAGLTGNMNHFDPFSALFKASQRTYVVLSDVGVTLMGYLLVCCNSKVGIGNVMLHYLMPYMWVNHWIAYTSSTPHYGDSEWTYIKGALSTVDRTTGFIGRHFFHDLIDFHVIHHQFPKIPFYRAEEATRAVLPILGGQYHQAKEQSFLASFVETFWVCRFVRRDSYGGKFVWNSSERLPGR